MTVVVGCVVLAAAIGYVVGYVHGMIHDQRRRARRRHPSDVHPVPNPYDPYGRP